MAIGFQLPVRWHLAVSTATVLAAHYTNLQRCPPEVRPPAVAAFYQDLMARIGSVLSRLAPFPAPGGGSGAAAAGAAAAADCAGYTAVQACMLVSMFFQVREPPSRPLPWILLRQYCLHSCACPALSRPCHSPPLPATPAGCHARPAIVGTAGRPIFGRPPAPAYRLAARRCSWVSCCRRCCWEM